MDRQAALTSLKESEAAREDFSALHWCMLKVANVDRRDVISHSDRVRYGAIGFFVLFFSVYSFFGWIAFISTIGIDDVGKGGGISLGVAAALLGAVGVATFDRVLVGQTKAKFEYDQPPLPAYQPLDVAELARPPSPPNENEDPEEELDADPDEDGSGVLDEDVDGAPHGADGTMRASAAPDAHAAAPARAVDRESSATQASPYFRSYVAASGQDAIDAFPSFVAGRPVVAAIFRGILALIIAFFLTTAIDRYIFAAAITQQQADNRIAELRTEIREADNRHKGRVAAYAKAVAAADADATQGRKDMLRAERFLGHGCPNSEVSTVCGASRKKFLDAQKALAAARADNPRDPRSEVFESYHEYIATRRETIARLRANPNYIEVLRNAQARRDGRSLASLATERGPLGPAEDLFQYLADNTGAAIFYGLMLIILLAIDLAAIGLKLGGYNSKYENRQALRDWLALTAVKLGERREHDRQRMAQLREAEEAAVRRAVEEEQNAAKIELSNATRRALVSAFSTVEGKARVKAEAEETVESQLRERFRQKRPAGDSGGTTPPQPRAGVPTPDEYEEGDSLRGEKGLWTLDARLSPHKQGAHSVVWKAHLATGDFRLAAIKVMPAQPPGQLGPATDLETARARNERRWLARLAHTQSPHIMIMWDKGSGRGGDWYAAPWAAEGTLADYYARRPVRQLSEVLAFAAQIVAGLQDAEDAVHGDIKPENLLLLETTGAGFLGAPQLVLADWGLARPEGEAPGMSHTELATVEYSAPQTLGIMDPGVTSVADDLFSVGAVIWWGVTGSPPGTDEVVRPDGGGAIFRRYIEDLHDARGRLPRLHTVQSTVPPEVSDFVRGLLKEQRADRTQQLDVSLMSRRSQLDYMLSNLNYLLAIIAAAEKQRGGPIEVGPGLMASANGRPDDGSIGADWPDDTQGRDTIGTGGLSSGRPSTGEPTSRRRRAPDPTADRGKGSTGEPGGAATTVDPPARRTPTGPGTWDGRLIPRDGTTSPPSTGPSTNDEQAARGSWWPFKRGRKDGK